MNDGIDPEELALELAKIAAQSTDPDVGRLLVKIVNRLLTDIGLPDGEE